MGSAPTPEGKQNFPTRLMLYMFRSCKRSEFDGIEIGVMKKKDADAYLKLHTLWSTLHGLISINMMGKENSRDEMNAMVLKDFITGFIAGIKG